ncbi:MAG: trypsin-like serine protease, partial [Bacteroidetes bacterium]|nr:trypsin-like serine protease [Bacteroidota bacterium]
SIIEADKEYDYIIFKIKSPKNYVFDYVKYSEQVLNIGENVFAIGNPLGLEKTLSKGIISGYRGDDNELIQTDTDVTHGSSGGPLFNMRGEVLGITSMVLKSGGANLNFAISIELLDLERFLD